jgi:hypothetical protein
MWMWNASSCWVLELCKILANLLPYATSELAALPTTHTKPEIKIGAEQLKDHSLFNNEQRALKSSRVSILSKSEAVRLGIASVSRAAEQLGCYGRG